jgi:hypothetical protein
MLYSLNYYIFHILGFSAKHSKIMKYLANDKLIINVNI